ncbi:hypothetical protein [Aeribacillus pallidus]|uniref:hypothetical protein n=1 Tax=Aeribacillus pallidus TaxID=33936 RepID=UPI003D24D35E
MENVNTLRLTRFIVVDEGKKRCLMIVQTLHREKPWNGVKPMKMLYKVKKFNSWIDELIDKKLVTPEFFNGEAVMVSDEYQPFSYERQEKARELIFKRQAEQDYEEFKLLNFSKVVMLEYRFFYRESGREMKKERLTQLVKLERKTDNYDFNTLLVLEKFKEGKIQLPEVPKGAHEVEITLKLEFAPDSNKNYGQEIPLEVILLAQEGVINAEVV